jgi:DNA-binding MarR family transcriptional regulator
MVGRQEASGTRPAGLGVALQQAWDGYRHQLDRELAAAGFGDRGFPDDRVLRLCSSAAEVTISQIGRELGITRQGASKIVASLRDRGYIALSPSPTDRREKIVRPTQRAMDFMAAQRDAGRHIEARVRDELGDEALDCVIQLLEALGAQGTPRRIGAPALRRD